MQFLKKQILQRRLSFQLRDYNLKISLKSSIEIFYIKKKEEEKEEVSLLNHLKLNCNVEEERAYKRA